MAVSVATRIQESHFWARLKRLDIERRLALILTVTAIVAGVATYAVITNVPPIGTSVRTVLFLLNFDLIVLILLSLVIARRIVRLVVQRRRGMAGSRLHSRLVMLFGLVAATPAIIVSIFSVLFLSSGLESWFSERVRSALFNSLNVAEAYLDEHKKNIRADAQAMAADLNRERTLLMGSTRRMQQFLNAQAALRSLSEAVLFDSTGVVMARSGLSFTMETDRLPQTIIDRADRGEIITLTSDADDRVRALTRLDGYGNVFLYVGRFVDSQVVGFMERTQRVVRDYEQMARDRSGIQITSALIFGIVALLLVLAAIWVGLNLADNLVAPIGSLITAAETVRGGDLAVRVPEPPETDELGILSRAFNRMTAQLENQRTDLVKANEQLDGRRRFTEAVLSGVSSGIIGLDGEQRVLLPNRAALEFFELRAGEIVGASIEKFLPEISTLLAVARARNGEVVEQQTTLIIGDVQRTLLVRIAAQTNEERVVGYVITFDDISELLSAQRQAAWAEVARRIAHEVKNPLTPIRLSAERLHRRYLPQIETGRDAFENSVSTIIRQVDVIGRLITEFSAFARLPALKLEHQSIHETIQHAVALERNARADIEIKLDLAPADQLVCYCDREKLGQALTNILQNAVEAMADEAAPMGAAAPVIVVRSWPIDEDVVIEIEDTGPGWPVSERDRLFDPYVTMRAGGTGLGLAIVRKIIEEHHGRVALESGVNGGALVRMHLPKRRHNNEPPGGHIVAAIS
ncbi:MAG: PAS domain-containing sensor histidine kinase [Pseudomonadota bacterium]